MVAPRAVNLDRGFTDIFWELSNSDENKRRDAAENLVAYVVNKKLQDKDSYLSYTRDRLSKGLKAFSTDVRHGFYTALQQFLKAFPEEFSAQALLPFLKKHIYSETSSNTSAEENSTKAAYILCSDLLASPTFVSKVTKNDAKIIVKPLFTLALTENWGSPALRQLRVLQRKLPNKINRSIFPEFINQIHTVVDSQCSSVTGDQLLFLISAQRCMKNIFTAHNIPLLDITSKKMRRKVVDSLARSSGSTHLLLLDEVILHNVIQFLWPKIIEKLNITKNASNSQRLRCLQLVTHVASNHSDETAQIVLTREVVGFLAKQLSSPKLACFTEACQLVRKMLDTVVGGTSKSDAMNATQADNSDNVTARPTTPIALFKCLTNHLPNFDTVCHHTAPKPCQFLLENASEPFDMAMLSDYAERLMQLFISVPEANKQSEGVDEYLIPQTNLSAVRNAASNQLHSLLQSLVKDNDRRSACNFDVARKLMASIVEFLTRVGLAAPHIALNVVGQHQISAKTAESCWSILFRFVDGVLKKLLKYDDPEVVKINLPINVCVAAMQLILAYTVKCHSKRRGGTDIDVFENELLPSLKNSLTLLKKIHESEPITKYMILLHSAVSMFALSQSSSEWSRMGNLLADIHECCQRYATPPQTPAGDDPSWPAVLTDAILSLLAYPSHMLRTVSCLTFRQMVLDSLLSERGGSQPSCLQLITDVAKTRLARSNAAGSDDDDEDEMSHGDAVDLVSFQSSGATYKVVTDADVSGDEKIDEDVDVGDESQSSSDDDDDDDSDDHENDSVDENQLSLLRESAKRALGPAAAESPVDGSETREFTDTEMFARDAALAEAFRANRLAAPQRQAGQQARILSQVKMRCLDLLGCIVRYSSDLQLLLPAIEFLLSLLRETYACQKKMQDTLKTKNDNAPGSRKRLRSSFIARHGDLPQCDRVIDTLRELKQRSPAVQTGLVSAMTMISASEEAHRQKVIDTLQQTVAAVVSAASKIDHPSDSYCVALSGVVKFICRSVSAMPWAEHESLKTVLSPLTEQLKLLTSSARRCRVHKAFFTSLMAQCPNFIPLAGDILLRQLVDILNSLATGGDSDQTSSTDERSSTGVLYTRRQCYDLLTHMLRAQANLKTEGDHENVSVLLPGLRAAIAKGVDSFNRLATLASDSAHRFISQPLLQVLMQTIRATRERRDSPLLFSDEAINLLQTLPKNNKPLHKAGRCFARFIQDFNSKFLSTAGPTERSREEKRRLKTEAKRARQLKRKQKALRRLERQNKAPQSAASGKAVSAESVALLSGKTNNGFKDDAAASAARLAPMRKKKHLIGKPKSPYSSNSVDTPPAPKKLKMA